MIDAAVFNLLSTSVDNGVSVVPVTDTVTSALPKVIFNLISGPRDYTDDGPVGIVSATYQLDVFAPTLVAASDTAGTIRSSLDGFSGSVDGVTIARISFPSLARPSREQVVTGTNFVVARLTLDMVVTFRE